MIKEIHWTGMVYTPSCEDISSWVARVVWGMDRKPLMRNAWRKTGYDWFAEEGDMAGGGGGVVVVSDGDGDIDDDNYDDYADILEEVLGAGDETDDDYDDDGMM